MIEYSRRYDAYGEEYINHKLLMGSRSVHQKLMVQNWKTKMNNLRFINAFDVTWDVVVVMFGNLIILTLNHNLLIILYQVFKILFLN